MKNLKTLKLTRLIVFSLVILGLAIYTVWPPFFSRFDPSTLQGFFTPVLDLVTSLGRILLLVIVLLAVGIELKSEGEDSPTNKKVSSTGWRVFVVTGFLFAAVSFMANPRSMYPTNRFPALYSSAREDKSSAYIEVHASPDVVILGSSRAASLSPDYIKEALGLSAFNFAVDSAQIHDYLIQTQYLLGFEDRPPPKVLLIEVQPDLLPGIQIAAEKSPSSMLPYMDTETTWFYFRIRYMELTDVNQFIESLYIVQKTIRNPDILSASVIDPIIVLPVNDKAEFERLLAKNIEARNPAECTELDPAGSQDIKEIVRLAAENDMAVILYNSPWHPDFYSQKMEKNKLYHQCQEIFESFIAELQSEYENLFFLNFTQVESIGGFSDETGFSDTHHLTPLNSNLFIDAAAETILQAYQWATNQRSEP